MTTTSAGNILILDDDPDVLYTARVFLKRIYNNVITEQDPQKIPELLRKTRFDIIILDMNFSPGFTSGKEGFHWMKYILKQDPTVMIILSTAYADIELAIEAMRQGAMDFLVKPWTTAKLLSIVDRVYNLKKNERDEKEEFLSGSTAAAQTLPILKYRSASMRKVLADIERIASTDAGILLLGENGTGKDVIAKQIHLLSSRNEKPFVKVDLGAIPESLFDTEISGHAKGAFTDAKEARTGLVEAADSGTLFLDEISNLVLPLQSKLLTIIQNRQITRVGTNQPVKVDFRLIAATNRDLHEMVRAGQFRQDLLYRINTIEIYIPPLRERADDIPVLLNHFIEFYANRYGKPGISIKPEAVKELQKYPWPGNIRELQHAIERAVILAEADVLSGSSFSLKGSAPSNPLMQNNNFNVEQLEKSAIESAIKKHGGNLSKAAVELGIGRSTLYRKMIRYGI
jgi:two-component system, NtrC family, response regulator HydG